MITVARWLADYYLLASVLLVTALGLSWLIAQPARRVSLTRATLAGLVLLAMLCALPGWSVVHLMTREASPPAAAIVRPVIERETAAVETTPVEAPVARPLPEVPASVSPPAAAPVPGTTRLSDVVVWAYLAGSLLVIAWQLLGHWRARALVRRARPAPLELQWMLVEIRTSSTPATYVTGSLARRRARLLISPTLPTAVALGIFRPTILLPRQLVDAADPTALRTILAHELAHIRHGDLRLLALCRGLFVLLWANPLFWLMRRRLRLDQETLADAAAAQVTTRHAYAEQLVDWAKRCATDRPPALAAAVGLWESPSQLRHRIAVLLDDRLTIWRECSRQWRLASLAVCAGVAVGLSLVTLEPSSVEADGLEDETIADKADGDNPASGTASESQVLKGQVRDASGQPVAGAKLWLVLRLGVDHLDGWLVRGASDKDGAFSLDVPGKWLASGDFWPDYTLWCYSPNHEVASKSAYRQLHQGKNEPLDVALPPQTDTSFVVYSPEGEPLENATIEPWHYLAGSYNVAPAELRQAVSRSTDKDGRAILSNLGRDELKSINVVISEYGVQRQELEVSADAPAERVVKLRSTGQLQGRLTGTDSLAVAHRRVTIEGQQERASADQTRGVAEAITDENGGFEVQAIAAGPIDLYVERTGSNKFLPRIPELLKVGANQTTSVEIPLERGVVAKGLIRTNQGHKPVRDALISVRTFYGMRMTGEVVRSDLNGRFTAKVLPGTVNQGVIMRPREYEDWIQVEDDQTEKVEVPSSATVVDLPPIDLVRTLEVTGQVLDENGLPIPAVRLSAITGNRVYSGAYTDTEGRFTLRRPDGIEIEKYEVQVDRNPGHYATFDQKDPLVLRLEGYHATQTNGPRDDSRPEKAAKGNQSESPSVLAPKNSSDEKPAKSETSNDDFKQRVELPIVVAKHVMLLNGNEIITLPELEERIAALPDPSLAFPQFFFTRGARESGLADAVKLRISGLRERLNIGSHGEGGFWPRVDLRYDQIEEASDLLPNPALRLEGTVFGSDGKPVAGAEVIVVVPVGDSVTDKAHRIGIRDGSVHNRLDEVVTDAGTDGRFAIYPPNDMSYYVIALHPSGGFGFVRDKEFLESPKISLLPWAAMVLELGREPISGKRPGVRPNSHIAAEGSYPEVVFHQVESDSTDYEQMNIFVFNQVPSNMETTVERSFADTGTRINIFGPSVKLSPDETRRLDLVTLSETEREQLERRRAELKKQREESRREPPNRD